MILINLYQNSIKVSRNKIIISNFDDLVKVRQLY